MIEGKTHPAIFSSSKIRGVRSCPTFFTHKEIRVIAHKQSEAMKIKEWEQSGREAWLMSLDARKILFVHRLAELMHLRKTLNDDAMCKRIDAILFSHIKVANFT